MGATVEGLSIFLNIQKCIYIVKKSRHYL